MRLRAVLPLLALCAILPGSAVAQERSGARSIPDTTRVVAAPDAVPGAVVSAVLRVPRPAGDVTGTFTVRVPEQVLLYGSPGGEVVARAGEGLVPLTFSVPKETTAGPLRIARVEVRWSDGSSWTAEVESQVGIRRGLALSLDTTSVFVARGATSHVPFRVHNTGNAADTIRLDVLKPERWAIDAPAPVLIEAGATHVDSIRIRMPTAATHGETQILRVIARGADSEAARNLAVTVAEQSLDEGGLLRLPATITVGAVDAGLLEETPVSLAIEMQGSLGGGTEASLYVRRSPDAATPPAFYQYLTGPSLRAELRNGPHHVTAGDVLFLAAPLHGGSAFGSGVDAAGQLGPVKASVFAARPYQFDAPERPGHLLGGTAEIGTGIGTFGVSASDMARPVGIIDETERTQLASVSWSGSLARGLTTRAEAGLMTLRDDDGRTREGVAFDVESAWHGERLDLQAHVRRVPGSLATSGSAVDETYINGAFDVGRGFSLNGWFVRNDVELLNGAGSTHDGSAVTVRWQDGRATAQVSGYLRQTSGSGLLTGDTEQRSVSVGGSVPVGPLTAEGTVEFGRTSNRDTDRPLRHITSRLSYQAGAAWAWLGLSHSNGVFGSDLTRIDAGSTVRAGSVQLDGRVGTWMGDGAGSRFDAWLSATYHVTPQTALIAGIDYAPWRATAEDVRVSLGARHSLGVPLPIHRRPQVHGVIYEDVNGNMRRDPGEPGIENVRVRRGNEITTTDRNGRYEFYGERSAPGELRVDAGSLAPGLMLLPTDGIVARGRVDIPVLRAAALRLFVYEDRDRDATRDALERGAAGAMIELADADGRTRTASADPQGYINFAALAPGEYSVRARIGVQQDQEAGAAVRFTLTAGDTLEVEVGAPRTVREIRFGIPPDTTRSDTVTVIAPDSTGDRPLRSDVRPTPPVPVRVPEVREARDSTPVPAEQSDTGEDLDSVGMVPEQTPSAQPEPDSTASVSRTSYGIGLGAAAIGLGVLVGLLLWFMRRRNF
ncbi:MAG: SdrD B-like domain-containing protein [Longimicrobiales bacterium]